MTKRKIEYWVIPPEQDAEFVACMEEVLETYAEAYDPKHPVLCMDEQPVQLLKETRVPIAATKKHGKRVDYEYERNGTASIFMFAEPLVGLPAGDRPRATDQDRLGGRSGANAGYALCGLRASDLRAATISTRTPKERSMKRSNRTERERTSSGSNSVTRRNTAVG